MVKVSDPRQTITTELPSMPGSIVVLYTSLKPKDQRAMQSTYSDVMTAILKNNDLQGKTAEEMKDMTQELGDVDLGRLAEMNVYQIALHIKSRNLEKEDGTDKLPVSFESVDERLTQEDLNHLSAIIKPSEEKKEDS